MELYSKFLSLCNVRNQINPLTSIYILKLACHHVLNLKQSIDDIIYASASSINHFLKVALPLTALYNYNLRLNFDKCHFAQYEVRALATSFTLKNFKLILENYSLSLNYLQLQIH